jgi:hypothetical protein
VPMHFVRSISLPIQLLRQTFFLIYICTIYVVNKTKHQI